MLYAIIIALVAVVLRQVIFSLRYLHILQLEGYKLNQYFGWLRRNIVKTFIFDVLLAIIGWVIINIEFESANPEIDGNNIAYNFLFNAILGILIAFNLIVVLFRKKVDVKKKLVYTNRIIRAILTTLVLVLIEDAVAFTSAIILYNHSMSMTDIYAPFLDKNTYTQVIYYLVGIGLLIPINVLIANVLNLPLETSIQNGYKKKAKEKLASNSGVKVIGITGSFGKTSTKNILNTFLTGKYHVLMSPSSFNTPMGLCKVVNDQLNSEHEILIAEMGARYEGDIKELCDFVSPSIGIITSIGPQHLETMKTVDRIAKTKFELVDSLPDDGFIVLNGDNEYCMKLKDTAKCRVVLFGINNTDVDIYATDIHYSKQGTSFVLNSKNGARVQCVTKLLGLHNINNILAAACAAVELGVAFERLKPAIGVLEPIEHRLQIVPTNNGITVIDDAFNSNPVGSKMALDVIKEFSGNKIIVTPGMVELGKMEYEHNKEFGKNIAAVCNFAVLVGTKRSKPIVEGLIEAGFPQKRIIVVNSLNEATAVMGKFVKPGDVVLFENDLPDNYNE